MPERLLALADPGRRHRIATESTTLPQRFEAMFAMDGPDIDYVPVIKRDSVAARAGAQGISPMQLVLD